MLGFGPIGSAPIGGGDKRNARVFEDFILRLPIGGKFKISTAPALPSAALNSLPR